MTEPKELITLPDDELQQDGEGVFDQTTFADDVSYRNQGSRKFTVKKTDEELAQEKKAQKKQRTILAVVGGVVVMVAIIAVLAMMMNNGPIVPDDVKPLAPSRPVDDGFTKKINDTQVILKEADPSVSEYQVPPVNMELRLDPAER